METLAYEGPNKATVIELKVKVGGLLARGKLVLLWKASEEEGQVGRLKSSEVGKVTELLVKAGDGLSPGQPVLKFKAGCAHSTVMKDMCAECGADLRKLSVGPAETGVAMVHAIPELKVSMSEAAALGREDVTRLTADRKLVLLVDLDQTLIHTTNDNVSPQMPGVYHFQLYGPGSPWYHTRIRPGTAAFLQKISHLYELHICTFGARLYAHQIAKFLDPKGKLFSHRILSRDECFDSRSKTANMSALFPCGDSMVCIIDDREDVWNFAPNMVHVKPYHFFKHTGDINAPPGFAKREFDGREENSLRDLPRIPKKVPADKKVEEEDDSSSEDEPLKADPRRDSIDMPQFDSNSRDHHDSNKAETTENTKAPVQDSKTDSKDMSKMTDDACDKHVAEDNGEKSDVGDANENAVSDNHNNKTKEDESNATNTQDKPVGDDLEISDSDSSSGKKSQEVSDAEEDSKKVNKDEDVDDNDDYLLYLEDILRTVHKAYYDLYDQCSGVGQAVASGPVAPAPEPLAPGRPDLKLVIPYVRRKVLQGVVLVLSGVVPTHIDMERSKPYLLAKALGARVQPTVDASITHVVAARLGTVKVNDARRVGGVHLVTPDWLWACAERWEKVSERLFTLQQGSQVTRRPPLHCSSPEIAFAERCNQVTENLNLNLDGALARQPSVAEADPFLSFSTEDLAGMDKEVEDILSGESDTDSEGEGGAEASSSEDSLTGEVPRGHKRLREEALRLEGERDSGTEDTNLEPPGAKRRNKPEGEQADEGGEAGDGVCSDDSGEEEDDWGEMGAELERELSDD